MIVQEVSSKELRDVHAGGSFVHAPLGSRISTCQARKVQFPCWLDAFQEISSELDVGSRTVKSSGIPARM